MPLLPRGKEVLVIDGVLAHALAPARGLTVELVADPALRLERRRRFYAWKRVEGAALDDALGGRSDGEDKLGATSAALRLGCTRGVSRRSSKAAHLVS